MASTAEERQTKPSALFITDREMAPMLGVSVGFLQKDRRGAKIIPFIKIGDRCLYDPAEAVAALKSRTVGGNESRRRRGGAKATGATL